MTGILFNIKAVIQHIFWTVSGNKSSLQWFSQPTYKLPCFASSDNWRWKKTRPISANVGSMFQFVKSLFSEDLSVKMSGEWGETTPPRWRQKEDMSEWCTKVAEKNVGRIKCVWWDEQRKRLMKSLRKKESTNTDNPNITNRRQWTLKKEWMNAG